jgi:hypothetical protein
MRIPQVTTRVPKKTISDESASAMAAQSLRSKEYQRLLTVRPVAFSRSFSRVGAIKVFWALSLLHRANFR